MRASALPWFEALDPVTVRVQCGERVHRVTWRRGKLVVEDHNLTAERSLAAFGGVSCACMAVFDSWNDRKSRQRELANALSALEPVTPKDEDQVVTVSAPPEVGMLHRMLPSPGATPGIPRQVVLAIEARVRQEWMQAILPRAFVHRLWLGDVMRSARRWDLLPLDVRIEAQAVVHRRVAALVVDGMLWWRQAFPEARPSVRTDVVAASVKPWLTGWIDQYSASAVVTLPLSWVVTVWARGLAIVDGCFVLDAVHTRDGVEADVVRWERVGPGTSEPVTVPARLWRDRQGDWRLRWA